MATVEPGVFTPRAGVDEKGIRTYMAIHEPLDENGEIRAYPFFSFAPEAYRLIFTASDATLLPYADYYFEYDPYTRRVTKEIAAVCETCGGGGTTADLLAYGVNPRYPTADCNTWQTRTVQTLPDNSQIVVYANYAGVTMLKVTIDSTGENKWATFYRYSDDGLETGIESGARAGAESGATCCQRIAPFGATSNTLSLDSHVMAWPLPWRHLLPSLSDSA
jgi:hypothetical protein